MRYGAGLLTMPWVRVWICAGLFGVLSMNMGCRPKNEGNKDTECSLDAECSGFCVEGVCVECKNDAECGCSEVCEENRCRVLGADLAIGGRPKISYLLNAHGRWLGADPESSSYRLQDAGTPLCTGSTGCGAGTCNPLTGGCVTNPTPCNADESCAPGPNGEVTTCVNIDGFDLCMPVPLCRSNNNCCADQRFGCDTGLGLCRPRDNECVPPESLSSTCPTEPKEMCDSLRFCSSLGTCVECVCDEDCGTNFFCLSQDGTCRQEGYCTAANQCDAPVESCDVRSNQCKPRCEDKSDCAVDEFCNAAVGNVCRPLSELSCQDDVNEEGAGNNDITSATSIVLGPVGTSLEVIDLSICTDDEDWFVLELERGDRLSVVGRGLSGFEGSLRALGPDKLTELDIGSVGGNNLVLQFTANSTGVYYVAVGLENAAEPGFYQLIFTRAKGEACNDPFEVQSGQENNDVPAGATSIFVSNDVDATPEGCARTGIASDLEVRCPGLLSCEGDVDYYAATVLPGSRVAVGLGNFAGDLNIFAYGPFDAADLSTLSLNGVLPLGYSARPAAEEENTAFDVREGGVLIFRTEHVAGASTNYTLTLNIAEPAVACIEDAFDGAVAALPTDLNGIDIIDAEGLNDSLPTASIVALEADVPVVIGGGTGGPLRLCPLDSDWFELGVRSDDGAGVIALPAGYRVQVQANVEDQVPWPQLKLSTAAEERVSSTGSLMWPVTTGEDDLFLSVSPTADSAPGIQEYTLNITLRAPPVCDADILGDPGEGALGNAAPSLATQLQAGGTEEWPDVVGERLILKAVLEPLLGACAGDDDWYRYDVPDAALARITIAYDPGEADLVLALYDAQVAEISEPTTVALPSTGLLEKSDSMGSGYQSVRLAGAATGYFVVRNASGWPVRNYALGIELHPLVCAEDAFEENDDWQSAKLIPIAASPYKPAVDSFRLDPITLCALGGEEDWFKVFLAKGDRIQAAVQYTGTLGKVDVSLFAPGPAGLNAVLQETLGTDTGLSSIDYTLGDTNASGAYLLRLRPRDAAPGYVFFSGDISRACVDDSLEPDAPVEVAELGSDAGPVILRLCNDADWFRLSVPATTTLTVCIEFEHQQGDIDLSVYDSISGTDDLPTPGGAVVGISATKNDSERVVIQNAGGARTYGVQIGLDPRDDVQTEYTLRVLSGDVGCP